MEFPFTMDLEINGMHLHQVEGYAVIERCPVDRSDWHVGDIIIHNGATRSDPDYQEQKLTFPHHLFVPVNLYLLNQRRSDIEWEWGQHLNQCKAKREAA